jgi:hypothetical protein
MTLLDAVTSLENLLKTLEGALEVLRQELEKQNSAPAQDDPTQPTIVIPHASVTGGMSIFGLDWDAHDDEGDQAPDGTPLKGAWGDETHNKTLVGCALPIKVIHETFPGGKKPVGYRVRVFSQVTKKIVDAVICDKGPAVRVRRPIDGTYALHAALGHLEYGLAKYGAYTHFPATFPVTFWVQGPDGKLVDIKGWDVALGQVA